jgi:hypothetical protein
LGIEAIANTDLHGRLLDRSFWYPEIEVDMTRGDYAYAQVQDHREVLDQPFAIRPGVVIPAGRYD